MIEQEQKGISLTSIIIGIGIGAIIVYLIYSNRKQTQQIQPATLNSNYSQILDSNSNLMIGIGSLQHRIDSIEQRLDRLQMQPIQTPMQLQIPQQSQISQIQQTQTQANQAENTYKNNEQWKIQRNEKGRIESIDVVRNAKISNKQ